MEAIILNEKPRVQKIVRTKTPRRREKLALQLIVGALCAILVFAGGLSVLKPFGAMGVAVSNGTHFVTSALLIGTKKWWA